MTRKHIIDTVEDLISETREVKQQNTRIESLLLQLLSETREVKRINDDQLAELKNRGVGGGNPNP